ncbi:PREDICTED: A-kinase anchor protein 14-like [Priapulus caudatus]|uniref:A-kinase anchor protein 14-like n=1 Tax=Priapulus caudatus TaxID=37621 RepID=A0ABM1EC40_PRICU|nr:PREDICTED: A-kinase anchor protein 14-like [Priapulus caudatus]
MDTYVREARSLVDTVVKTAISILLVENANQKRKLSELQDMALNSLRHWENVQLEENYIVENIQWPTIAEFTTEKALQKIDEFIRQTWKYSECWLFCIDFIREEIHPYSKRYIYIVKWSRPTKEHPIPRATASIYFTIELSTIKPEETPVYVAYTFEGNRLIHRPGMSRFREKWLQEIIDSKALLMSEVKF